MLRCLLSAYILILSAALVSAAQSSSGAGQQSQSEPPATGSASAAAASATAKSANTKDQPGDKDAAKDKKKPRKVWTEDDISKVGGTISVVGDSSDSSPKKAASQPSGANSDDAGQNKQIEYYRDQLRQLQAQLDSTDKKINDLKNFKADNGSASGGINPNNGYSMTPIADQIKQLEDKRKQIQGKIDAVTDEARKKGIEPGQLR